MTLAAAYRSTTLAANSTSGRDTMSEPTAPQAAFGVAGDSAGIEPQSAKVKPCLTSARQGAADSLAELRAQALVDRSQSANSRSEIVPEATRSIVATVSSTDGGAHSISFRARNSSSAR